MLIITDSAADIPADEAKRKNLSLVRIPVSFGLEDFVPESERDYADFYEKLENSDSVPTTSQASPEAYLSVFGDAKERGEEILVVTLSSGLSGTYRSALTAKERYGWEKVYVVDSRSAAFGQKFLAETALELREKGLSAREIAAFLEDVRERTEFYCVLDTLKYLKKGGRIPAGLAGLGALLNVKPMLRLHEGVLSPDKKCLGRHAALKSLSEKLAAALPSLDPDFPVSFAYTFPKEEGEAFLEECKEKYGLKRCTLSSVGPVVGTHIGKNAVGVAFVLKK